MAEYIFNKQIANETSIRIETNNREFFIGIEEIINSFLNHFTNENEPDTYDGIELMDLTGFENIEYVRFENINFNGFENENNGANELGIEKNLSNGIENPNGFENETHRGIENSSEKNSGNELRSLNLSKYSYNSSVSGFKFVDDENSSKIHTKWGVARIDSGGHYKIVGGKYANQQLHRLLYEDYHKVCLLDEAVIHHIDENKLNNDITNLIAVSKSEHRRIHNMLNNSSKTYSNTEDRYYRVYKQKNPNTTQGFTYKYQWYGEDGKRKAVERVNFKDLERAVKSMGLPWRKL